MKAKIVLIAVTGRSVRNGLTGQTGSRVAIDMTAVAAGDLETEIAVGAPTEPKEADRDCHVLHMYGNHQVRQRQVKWTSR